MLYIIDVIKYIYYNINPSSTIIYITSTRQAHISALKSVMYIDLSSTHFHSYFCGVQRLAKQSLPSRNSVMYQISRRVCQAHTLTLNSAVYQRPTQRMLRHLILSIRHHVFIKTYASSRNSVMCTDLSSSHLTL